MQILYVTSNLFNNRILKVVASDHVALLKGVSMRRRMWSFKDMKFFKGYGWLSIGLSLTLSGCMGIYEGAFECPPGKGVGCKSISEVNHMVNDGVLPPKPQIVSSQEELSQSISSNQNWGLSEAKECESCAAPSSPLVLGEPLNLTPQIWYAPSESYSLEKMPSEQIHKAIGIKL